MRIIDPNLIQSRIELLRQEQVRRLREQFKKEPPPFTICPLADKFDPGNHVEANAFGKCGSCGRDLVYDRRVSSPDRIRCMACAERWAREGVVELRNLTEDYGITRTDEDKLEAQRRRTIADNMAGAIPKRPVAPLPSETARVKAKAKRLGFDYRAGSPKGA